MINKVYHLLAKNNKGEGRGLKREGGLVDFFPLKRGFLERGASKRVNGNLNFSVGYTVVSVVLTALRACFAIRSEPLLQ